MYFNGYMRRDFFLNFKRALPQNSPEELAIKYLKFVEHMKWVNSINLKKNFTTCNFNLGIITTEEGVKLKVPHWSNDSMHTLHGESLKCLTHTTSNVPNSLTSTQTSTAALSELSKPGSKNLGTIITLGEYKLISINVAAKIIPKWRLDFVYFLVYGKEHNSEFNDIFIRKKSCIAELLGVDPKNSLVDDIVGGYYDNTLEMDREASFNDILSTALEAKDV